MKKLFSTGPSLARRLLALALLSLLLLLIDTYTHWLAPAKARLQAVAMPFHWITNLPARLSEWGSESVVGRAELEAENQRLRREQLILRGQLQRMAGIAAENVRLRNLLNATELLKDRVLVAELIGVSPNPLEHSILINRGTDDGAYVGQPVLDDKGLMGQVVEVRADFSRVLLITDGSHALPVQILRNGVRAIVEGTGDFGRLALRYISPTMDVKVGDELVSSGLGGRFPAGYPVGRVVGVQEGQAFMTVAVAPAANIERSRHLLLVFSAVEQLAPGEADAVEK